MKTKILIKINSILNEKHKFMLNQLGYRGLDENESEEYKKETDELIKVCDEIRELRKKLIDEIYNRIKSELIDKSNEQRTGD
jgi:hypothetical protein